MPLFNYECKCGNHFSKLSKNKSIEVRCRKCAAPCLPGISVPGVETNINPGYQPVATPKEIDKVVGMSADDKWEAHANRVQERHMSYANKPGFVDKNIVDNSGVNISEHLGSEKRQFAAGGFSSAFSTGAITRDMLDVGPAAK